MKRFFIEIVSFLCILFMIGCSTNPTVLDQDFLEIKEENDLEAMINGAYSDMVDWRFMGREDILIGEVRADNVYSNSRTGRYGSMSKMTVEYVRTDTDDDVGWFYQYLYSTIGKANVIINSDFDNLIVEGEESNKFHILGEAYAIRAFSHFEALKFFGQQFLEEGEGLGVAYVTEYKSDDFAVRESVEDNKKHIYQDIERAIENMKKGQGSAFATDKTNFTLDAVYALQSRVGVYFGTTEDYAIAKNAAEEILGKYILTPANQYVNYWKDSAPGAESIFELERSTNNNDGSDNLAGLYHGVYSDIVAFKNVREDAEFDENDVRASKEMIDWDGNELRNYGKYPSGGEKLGSDNIKVFRYAEVVLNYAEAILHSDPVKAKDYLNEVAVARNAIPYTEANMENILKERRKEFIFEGFRFHDLARTGRDIPDIDPTAPNNHGVVPYGSYKYALPIPRHDMDSNPEMKQNPGYKK